MRAECAFVVSKGLTLRCALSGNADRTFCRTHRFGSHRIAKALGDAEMLGAVALLDPGPDQLDGDAFGLRLGRGEVRKLREPFEIAPRREDDLDPSVICRVEHILRARPEARGVFGLVDSRIGRVVGRVRNIETRIEHPCLLERRAPARERDERIEIELQPRFGEQRAERFARVEALLRRGDPAAIGLGLETHRNRRLFERLADRGDTRGAFGRVDIVSGGDFVIVGIDPPAGKDDRAAGKGHAGRSLDDEKLGWTIRAMPKDDERGGGDTGGRCALLSCFVVIHRELPILPFSFVKGAMMGIMEILGVAGSVSLLAGWRLYLCVFATGLAMRLGWIAAPEHLQSLAVLSNNWVIGVSAVGMIAEFFADKVAWLDSLWDAVHTAIRPIGGALLALALVDASNPTWQVVTLLLGGGAALMAHGAKAGTRAVVNASPEPFSNIAVSTGEDVATGGLLFLALSNPIAAIFVAIIVAAASAAAIVTVRRVLKKLFGVKTEPAAPV